MRRLLSTFLWLVIIVVIVTVGELMLHGVLAQKLTRTVPVPVGNKTQVEILGLNLNFAFESTTQQFLFTNASYVYSEGDVVNGAWVEYSRGVNQIDAKDASQQLQNAVQTIKERMLRNYIQVNKLEKQSAIEAAKTTTTSTTTTSTASSTVPTTTTTIM